MKIIVKLRECPHCGGRVMCETKLNLLFIKCPWCGCITSFNNAEANMNTAKAAECWNRRYSEENK